MKVNQISRAGQKHYSYSFVYGNTFQEILDKEVKKIKKGEQVEKRKEINQIAESNM